MKTIVAFKSTQIENKSKSKKEDSNERYVTSPKGQNGRQHLLHHHYEGKHSDKNSRICLRDGKVARYDRG